MDRTLFEIYEIAEKSIENDILNYEFKDRTNEKLCTQMKTLCDAIGRCNLNEKITPLQLENLLEIYLHALKNTR